MWCRATQQPVESWMILTRAERRAMSDLADEVAAEERKQAKGVRRGR